MATAIELPITRFNFFMRAADENEGLDEREVLRLFSKRKLVVSIDVDDIERYGEGGWDPDSAADLQTFIDAEPRSSAQVMDYLGEEPADEDDAEGEGVDADEDGDEDSGSVVPEKYRIKYGAAQNCGDEIALALTEFTTLPRAKKNEDGGLDRSKLRAVCEANGIADKLATWEERGLNGGLLRMNTSNVLRGMNRRGEEVSIGSAFWPAHEVPPKAKKSRARASAKKVEG